jgi:hypothetical protein
MTKCFFRFAMPLSISLLLTPIFFVCVAADSTPTTNATETSPDKSVLPHIRFDRLIHDFGDVLPGSTNYCTFTFTNIGPGTLHITGANATCSCTTPVLEDKKEYAPGGFGQIKVQLHAYNRVGPISQNVFVYSDDPDNPDAQLAIHAEVPAAVRVTPKSITLTLIGDGAKNAEANDEVSLGTELTLKSADGKPFAVTGVSSVGDLFVVDFDPHKIAREHAFSPRVKVALLRQFPVGYLVFKTDHPVCKSVEVQYTSLKEIEISPAVVMVRNAVVGEPQKQTVHMLVSDEQPVEMDPASSDKGIVRIVSKSRTNMGFDFEVEITPPAKEERARVFADVLHLRIRNKEAIDIPCRGFYKTDQ